MRRLAVGLIAVALAATPQLRAQQSQTVGAFELRPLVGAYIPTGAMRNEFRDAVLAGAQGGFEFSSDIHLILSGFWSRNDTHVAIVGDKQADIWQFDAGGEFNLIRPMGRAWLFRPFVGGGAGIRTYDFQTKGVTRCGAAYGSVGAEAQRFEGAFRFEARDYASCYESPVTSLKKVRNDVALSLGFVYHIM